MSESWRQARRQQDGQARRRAWKELRQRQRAEGLKLPRKLSLSNAKCELLTKQEELSARQEAVVEQVRVMRLVLPTLLASLSQIPDPRAPKKRKHQLTVLMVYGVLMFVLQMASRREANRTMTRPVFMENLKQVFPELETLPHHDTLYRLLARVDVEEIQVAHLALIRKLIRKKTFRRFLVEGCFPVAVDGTQKVVREVCWAEECQQRERKHAEGSTTQYYVYVLEASLAFRDGMVIPLMSEILSWAEGDEGSKQDCELKAFKRLAARLKKEFPHLPIMLLLDGLYPNGPIMRLCRSYGWQYMIVLKDSCLPRVWQEANGLKQLQPSNRHQRAWGDRRQAFWWVNNIEYEYVAGRQRREVVHVAVCEESWQELARDSNAVITRSSRHAWISSTPLSRANLHPRCNLAARHRWGIEESILVEKRHGYQYEHCFAYNWNAMKGYHYLMRLGHLLNVLAHYSERLVTLVRKLGVRAFIQLIRETIAGPWLTAAQVKTQLATRRQLRLCWPAP